MNRTDEPDGGGTVKREKYIVGEWRNIWWVEKPDGGVYREKGEIDG